MRGGVNAEPYQALANSLDETSSLPKNVGTSNRLANRCESVLLALRVRAFVKQSTQRLFDLRKARNIAINRQCPMRWPHGNTAVPMSRPPAATTRCIPFQISPSYSGRLRLIQQTRQKRETDYQTRLQNQATHMPRWRHRYRCCYRQEIGSHPPVDSMELDSRYIRRALLLPRMRPILSSQL